MQTPTIIRPRDLTNTKVAYLPPGDVIDEGALDPHRLADIEMCKKIGVVLARHYPGIPWGVHCDSKQGIATIAVPVLMGATGKYILKLADLATDPGLASVMRAGGEILERFRINRGHRPDRNGFADALATRRMKSSHADFPE